jgi:cytochrome oxidase assembly protein ShyY1
MTDRRSSGSRQLMVILGSMALFFLVLVLLANWAVDRG